jgi:hypothetical protein
MRKEVAGVMSCSVPYTYQLMLLLNKDNYMGRLVDTTHVYHPHDYVTFQGASLRVLSGCCVSGSPDDPDLPPRVEF